MERPNLIFVAGCNASGKSTFIHTRLNELSNSKVIMTDVYKGRTKEIFKDTLQVNEIILF